MAPKLFESLDLGPFSLPNRVAVSPMCQYSADDGSATDWHLQHLMQLAISGAGLVMVEATAVERRGRITHGCLGLYSDSNERHLTRVMDAARAVAPKGTRFGIQLAHAGRKASTHLPWEGGKSLSAADDAWQTVAPSALPYTSTWHTPNALTTDDMKAIVQYFVQAAQRADRAGFDLVELHFAHGYLGHQFFSPLSNHRTDNYGGSRENRHRFLLEIANAVRDGLPKNMAFGARISANDWVEGGATVEDAADLATQLKAAGASYVCVSSGGVAPATIPFAPGYLAPYAEQVKQTSGIATRVSGLIASPEQAETIVASGQADVIAMARAFLDNPRWVWHAADRLGATVAYPPQYERSKAKSWPGAALARPEDVGEPKK